MIEQHEGETTIKVKTHLDNMVTKILGFFFLNKKSDRKIVLWKKKSYFFLKRIFLYSYLLR